jgi:hypothetical protein
MKRDESETVVIGSPEAYIEFGHPDDAADGSGSQIPLRVVARGVDVHTIVDIESWSGGTKSLIDYFGDLSAAWRGWPGPKDWNDDGPNVSMSATHDGVGHVRLEVIAQSHSGWDGEGSWTVTVRVPIEPGALTAVATKLEALLAPRPLQTSGEEA